MSSNRYDIYVAKLRTMGRCRHQSNSVRHTSGRVGLGVLLSLPARVLLKQLASINTTTPNLTKVDKPRANRSDFDVEFQRQSMN